ncbi:MAG: PAS domain-containing sensor histidine kinase [Ignavibacteriaceae bacterium]
MSKILQNTLEIIGNISLSTAGYLLKLNEKSAEVIAIAGENKDKFEVFNNDIIVLYRQENIYQEGIKALPSYKILASELSLKSVFFKKVFASANNEYVIYLFLFSGRVDNYNDNNLKMVLNVVDTLTNQVKDISHNFIIEIDVKDDSGKVLDNKINPENLTVSNDLLLKSLMDASEDFIFILDNNGSFINVNNNGALLLDYTQDELIGKHFLDIIDFKGKAAVGRSFQQILRSKNLYKFESSMVSKSGKTITLEINGKAIFFKDNVTGMLGVGKNITKQKVDEGALQELNYKLIEANRLLMIERARSNQRKAILEELNELKSEFISNISHELRTPLASIIGFSETIASDPGMQPEMKSEFNSIILQEGKRLAKLINDILDLSRIESGEIDLSKIDFDIISVVKEVIEHYKKPAASKHLTLTFGIPDEEIFINADKERITKALSELLSNAVKFTKEGGRISIIAQSLHREFELIVNDTGVGIPEKDLPYIFQKFYRVSRPGSEVSGTGLGLVFVKQIIDLHKGLILVQSEINKGTSFIVKLPKSIKAHKNKV